MQFPNGWLAFELGVLRRLKFTSVALPFTGEPEICVQLKSWNIRVAANDPMIWSYTKAFALIENNNERLDEEDLFVLLDDAYVPRDQFENPTLLKWFNAKGELLRTVPVPGSQPSNIALMASDHIAIASLNGMILILDGEDRVVSAVGGEPPVYENGVLKPLVNYNTTFNHPHDVYVDAAGAMYVAQWNSNRSYPLKFERVTS